MEDNGCLRPLEIMGRANTDSIQSKILSPLNILEVLIYLLTRGFQRTFVSVTWVNPIKSFMKLFKSR